MLSLLNMISGFIPPIVNVLVGIILTPMIISSLGIEAYSYWPICNSLTLYVGLVTVSLGPGLRRHTVYALDSGNMEEAREYLNTGLAMTSVFWFFLVLLGAGVSFFLPKLFVIKQTLRHDVQLLFFFTALASSLEVFGLVFFVGAYARNRLFAERITRTISPLSRLILVWAVFALFAPSIVFLGGSALVGALITLAVAIITFYKYLPQLEVNPIRYCTLSAVKELSIFGGWVLCAALGDFLFRNLQFLIANRYVTPAEAGYLGVVIQVTGIITVATGHVGYIISRKILSAISQQAEETARATLSSYYTWTVCGLAFPLAMLFINAEHIFSLWLHDSSPILSNLLRVAIVATFISEPLSLVNSRLLASKRILTNGIATLLTAPCLIVFSYVMLHFFHLGIIGIALASGGAMLLRNISLVVDLNVNCGHKLGRMAKGFSVSSVSFCVIVFASYARKAIIPSNGYAGIFFDLFSGFIIWFSILWVCSDDWRNLVKSLTSMLTTDLNNAKIV